MKQNGRAEIAIFLAGIVFGVVLAWLLWAPQVVAAKPLPMHWSENQRTYQLVEQQGNIANPTPCAWDKDDRVDGMFTGVLGKGETVTHTECVILDHASHLVGISVGEGLIGSIHVGRPIGPTFAGWTDDDRCLLTPEYDSSLVPGLPQIGDGHGDRVPVTWSVTNVSGHRLGRAVAVTTIQLNTTQARETWGCP